MKPFFRRPLACLGLTWGTARLILVGDTSGRSTRLPTLPMPQREARGGAGKGLRKVLLGPRLRGRVWTEAAICYTALRGGEVLCGQRKRQSTKVSGEAKWLDRFIGDGMLMFCQKS